MMASWQHNSNSRKIYTAKLVAAALYYCMFWMIMNIRLRVRCFTFFLLRLHFLLVFSHSSFVHHYYYDNFCSSLCSAPLENLWSRILVLWNYSRKQISFVCTVLFAAQVASPSTIALARSLSLYVFVSLSLSLSLYVK